MSSTVVQLPPRSEKDAHDEKICDKDFLKRCCALRRGKQLLALNGIEVKNFERFPVVDQLKFSRRSRSPSESEFTLLNELEASLSLQTTSQIRTQLLAKRAREIVVHWAYFSLCISVMSYISGVLIVYNNVSVVGIEFSSKTHILIVPCYIIFAITLGFLGSTTSIALSSLSVKSDDKFDLTDSDLVKMRIIVGGLFALCLAVPWTPRAFWDFSVAATKDSDAFSDAERALKFVLPFIFGFSTSVVLLMITRVTESIETILGFSKRNP